MKTKRQKATNITGQYVSFNTTDTKGREVGASITTFEIDFVEDAQATFYYTQPAGHYFAFQPHATRNDKWYGASQPDKYFLSAAEREKAIEKYLALARKRASK